MNNNFTEIKSQSFERPNATANGWYLMHNRTGMKIVYFQRETNMNQFEFIFNTPGEDEYGTAHAVEHCLFRSSRKYPVDYLTRLIEQHSVNYDISANTSSGFSKYSAGSFIQKDFFNLLEVFKDIIFFPLFEEYVFEQENCHLALDENKNPYLTGVIYNEDKYKHKEYLLVIKKALSAVGLGDSSFNTLLTDYQNAPELTLEKVKAYHEKYYVPSNCTLFIHGSQPLDEMLEYLEQNILKDLPSCDKTPDVSPAFTEVEKTAYKTIEIPCSAQTPEPDSKLFVLRIRKNNKSIDEDSFVYNSLAFLSYDKNKNNLVSILEKEKTGDAVNVDVIPSLHSYFLAVEITNPVELDDVKLEKKILGCIEKAVHCSVDKKAVKTYFRRYEGDKQFDLLKCIENGLYYNDPFINLKQKKDMAELKNRFLSSGNDMLVEAADKYLLNNTEKAVFTLKKDPLYYEKRTMHEKELIQNLFSKTTTEDIEKKLRFYEEKTAEHNINIDFPSLDIEELKKDQNIIHLVDNYNTEEITSQILFDEYTMTPSKECSSLIKELYSTDDTEFVKHIYNTKGSSNMVTVLKTSPAFTEEQFEENMLLFILRSTDLNRKIRGSNSVYGIQVTFAQHSNFFAIYTHNDSNPEASRRLLLEVLKESCTKVFDTLEFKNFMNIRFAQWYTCNETACEYLRKLTPEKLNAAAKRLVEMNPNPRTVYYIDKRLRIANI